MTESFNIPCEQLQNIKVNDSIFLKDDKLKYLIFLPLTFGVPFQIFKEIVLLKHSVVSKIGFNSEVTQSRRMRLKIPKQQIVRNNPL